MGKARTTKFYNKSINSKLDSDIEVDVSKNNLKESVKLIINNLEK